MSLLTFSFIPTAVSLFNNDLRYGTPREKNKDDIKFFKAPMDSKLTPAVTDTLSYLGTLLDIKIVKDKM